MQHTKDQAAYLQIESSQPSAMKTLYLSEITWHMCKKRHLWQVSKVSVAYRFTCMCCQSFCALSIPNVVLCKTLKMQYYIHISPWLPSPSLQATLHCGWSEENQTYSLDAKVSLLIAGIWNGLARASSGGKS